METMVMKWWYTKLFMIVEVLAFDTTFATGIPRNGYLQFFLCTMLKSPPTGGHQPSSSIIVLFW
jgi:hypothetical protein